MNERAEVFLDRWCAENVGLVPSASRGAEAQRLAQECVADAIRAGIDMSDLMRAAGGNLTGYVLDEIRVRGEGAEGAVKDEAAC